MFSTSPHPSPYGLSNKFANCPALRDGTELQFKLIALREVCGDDPIDTYQAPTTNLATSHRRAPEQKTSLRTSAESHRAVIMKKTGSHSLAALGRLVLTAEIGG